MAKLRDIAGPSTTSRIAAAILRIWMKPVRFWTAENPNDSAIRLFVGIGAWHTEKRSDLDERIQAAQEAGQIDTLIGQRAGNVAHLALAARLMDRPQDAIRAGEIAQSILSLPELAPERKRSARIAAGLAAVATGDVQEVMEHWGLSLDIT